MKASKQTGAARSKVIVDRRFRVGLPDTLLSPDLFEKAGDLNSAQREELAKSFSRWAEELRTSVKMLATMNN